MRGHAFSEQERADAILIVAERGLAAAWRESGIPKPTLVRWCKDAGVERFHPERTRAAVDALQASAALAREQLRAELLDRALDLLERMDEPHVEFKGKDGNQVTYPIAPANAVQNYATSAAILIDKYRLEMGEATDRTETRSLSDVLDDHERATLKSLITGELADREAAGSHPGDGLDAGASPAST